ncbi:MAG TPA: hypothetical protein PKI11_09180 [Candidatus Hydrogenedentes bacterium]|nr:hypothetical protein [Candidatus Hydrogenedentota bacterium]
MGLLSLAITLALAGANEIPAPAGLSFWAVQAVSEQRTEKYFGGGLEAVRDSLVDLPFDSFYLITATHQNIPFGRESRIAIDKRYTLYVAPVARDAENRLTLGLRLEVQPQKPGDRPIIALSTKVAFTSGKQIKLGGFRLDRGELVLVLAGR